MKTLRFPAGTFLVIDAPQGGRRVVLVCRDGVTTVDSMDAYVSTPLTIHPAYRPEPMGTLTEFVMATGFAPLMPQLIGYARQFPGLADGLSFVRFLFEILQATSAAGIYLTQLTEPMADAARDKVMAEAEVVAKQHAQIAAYCAQGVA